MMNKIFGAKEMRLLMLGLDAAGKTSACSSPIPRDKQEHASTRSCPWKILDR